MGLLVLAKLIETTELTDKFTSFHTELESVDTTKSLQDRYDRYKTLLEAENNPPDATHAESVPYSVEK